MFKKDIITIKKEKPDVNEDRDTQIINKVIEDNDHHKGYQKYKGGTFYFDF